MDYIYGQLCEVVNSVSGVSEDTTPAYIYGQLCERVRPITYTGLETDTATTIVDNTDYTIKVNTKLNNDTVTQLITDKINTLDYDDTVSTNKYVAAVKQTNGKIEVTKVDFPIPETPAADGIYFLICTVVNGSPILSWAAWNK